tara:strand:- start:838 stop:1038 length:201 start_codon:yes stop_codon:yes gene_type:complete
MSLIDKAIHALGMSEGDATDLRMLCICELLMAKCGITNEQVDMAMENRLKQELRNVSEMLKELADA